MSRLLIIYLVIILASRIIRGFQESQRSAPKRREPEPFPDEGDVDLVPEVEAYSGEKRGRDIVAPWPSPSAELAPAGGEGVTLELMEIEKEHQREEEREKTLTSPRLPRERPVARRLFSQPEAWVQGFIMSEVLLPPRSQRPWRP